MNRERREREPEAAGTAAEVLCRSGHVLSAAEATAERVKDLVATYGATGEAQVAGRVAEEMHAGTFSMDAATHGRFDLLARTTASAGQPTAAADIEIQASAARPAQVKYWADASCARSALADPKYDGMQKVVPPEQVGSGVADRLRHDGVESAPLSREDAVAAARDPEAAGRALVRSALFKTVVTAGAIEAAVIGVRAGVQNFRAVKDGKREIGEAVIDTAWEAARGGADGAARAALVVATRSAAVRLAGPMAARSAVPLAVGLAGYEIIKNGVRVLDGTMEPQEFVARAKVEAIRAAGACGGAKFGGALGTMVCPGIGTVVGGVLGGIVGWIAGDRLAA